MKTSEISTGLQAASAQPAVVPRRLNAGDSSAGGVNPEKIEAGSGAPKTGETIVQRREFGVLNADKEAMGQAAVEVRALGEARKLVARAAEQLNVVVKSFPPFPPGSVEREQYLNSVVGIRSIIEKLTIPREPRAQLDDALGQEALINANVSDQQLQAGQNGLINADMVLADVQLSVGRGIASGASSTADEAYYMAQSKRIGAELARQSSGISRSGEAMLAVLG